MSITTSNNWKYKIDIKRHFQSETTPELTADLSNKLAIQLKAIKAKLAKSNIDEEDVYGLEEELDIIIDHFEFLERLSNGTIPEKDFESFGFDEDFEGWFNDYMSELYDLADRRVTTKQNTTEKFIWIN